MHEWKDFVSSDIDDVLKDPEFLAYREGFLKAKELYSKPTTLSFITSPIDHFLWWKDKKSDAS